VLAASVSVSGLVVVVGVLQTVYVTCLIAAFALRFSARIAVMEFKLDVLWSQIANRDEGP
jgi:hypothetical protein